MPCEDGLICAKDCLNRCIAPWSAHRFRHCRKRHHHRDVLDLFFRLYDRQCDSCPHHSYICCTCVCPDCSAFEPYEHGLIYARDCLRRCSTAGPICTEIGWRQNAVDAKLRNSRDGCAAVMSSLAAVLAQLPRHVNIIICVQLQLNVINECFTVLLLFEAVDISRRLCSIIRGVHRRRWCSKTNNTQKKMQRGDKTTVGDQSRYRRGSACRTDLRLILLGEYSSSRLRCRGTVMVLCH